MLGAESQNSARENKVIAMMCQSQKGETSWKQTTPWLTPPPGLGGTRFCYFANSNAASVPKFVPWFHSTFLDESHSKGASGRGFLPLAILISVAEQQFVWRCGVVEQAPFAWLC